MVVFGAGASNDSANFKVGLAVEQWRPPMGPALFQDHVFYSPLLDRYEPMRKLAHRFREGPHDSPGLEAELEKMQESKRVMTREQLVALRYYLQKVLSQVPQYWSNNLHGNTNYVGLVEMIDETWTESRPNDPVVFVTFNYDVLLDGALGQIKVKVGGAGDFDSYVKHPQYKLIKPHGSVNWFHHVPVPIKNAHPYYLQILPGLADGTLSASEDFYFKNELEDFEDIEGIPALSIPVAKKSKFEMPPKHLEVLKQAIPEVTHLLIIGWRGNEQYFVDMLNALDRTRLRNLVVTRSVASANEVATALNLHNIPPHVVGGGFTGLLRGPEIRRFLLAS